MVRRLYANCHFYKRMRRTEPLPVTGKLAYGNSTPRYSCLDCRSLFGRSILDMSHVENGPVTTYDVLAAKVGESEEH
jgi:hypothetical protein